MNKDNEYTDGPILPINLYLIKQIPTNIYKKRLIYCTDKISKYGIDSKVIMPSLCSA